MTRYLYILVEEAGGQSSQCELNLFFPLFVVCSVESKKRMITERDAKQKQATRAADVCPTLISLSVFVVSTERKRKEI